MFKQRIAVPELGNKYYICNKAYVLPDNLAYAVGRFNEILGEPDCKWLSGCDSALIFDTAFKQGLKTGIEPKLGAVAVWKCGKIFHLGVVERIVSNKKSTDDTIIISASSAERHCIMWRSTHIRGVSGNWTDGSDAFWMKNKYKLVGYIYRPSNTKSH